MEGRLRRAATRRLAVAGLVAMWLFPAAASWAGPAEIGDLRKIELSPSSLELIRNIKLAYTSDNLTAVYRPAESREAEGVRRGTVFVLVRRGIYQDVRDAIDTYTRDLAQEGFTTYAYTIQLKGELDPFYGKVKDLKGFIRARWLWLARECLEGRVAPSTFDLGTGVVLVGDLPVPLVHHRTGEWSREEPEGSGNIVTGCYEGVFVCDLYLTDMDGDWSYTDPNGIPLYTTVDPQIIAPDHELAPGDQDAPKWTPCPKAGNGGARPEIWIGRIDAKPVSLVNGQYSRDHEVELLTQYFARNHAYRHHHCPYVGSGLSSEECAARDRTAYFDDDFASLALGATNAHNKVWPGKICHNDDFLIWSDPVNRYIDDGSLTKADDYLQRLCLARHLWMESAMHSNWDGHEFRLGQNTEWLPSTSLSGPRLKALFHYLQGCHTADYRHTNNLGSVYLFPGEALGVLGNTGVGPHDTGVFYESLRLGMNLGQAQMMYQRGHARTDNWITTWPVSPGNIDPKRYYNQTLLGDPTLRPEPFIPTPQPIVLAHVIDYASIIRTLPFATTDELAAVQNRAMARFEAGQAGRYNVVEQMPEPGINYLRDQPGQPVIDPHWRFSVSPLLRQRVEVFDRGITPQRLPALRFRPGLQIIK